MYALTIIKPEKNLFSMQDVVIPVVYFFSQNYTIFGPCLLCKKNFALAESKCFDILAFNWSRELDPKMYK